MHTDANGLEHSNLKLTQARAEEIGRILVAEGVAMNRLNLKGFGSSRPLAFGNSIQDRLKNRRVEFVVAELCASPSCEAVESQQ